MLRSLLYHTWDQRLRGDFRTTSKGRTGIACKGEDRLAIIHPNSIPARQLLNIYNMDSLTKRRKLGMLLYLNKLVNGVLDDSALLSMLDFAVPRPNSRSYSDNELPRKDSGNRFLQEKNGFQKKERCEYLKKGRNRLAGRQRAIVWRLFSVLLLMLLLILLMSDIDYKGSYLHICCCRSLSIVIF
ncbi:hypothetical protein J6590_040708 [Homalodisca vitripennis]|nr:hypothetical protein J6590_040708 [Homalodisca vitripennis]